MNAHPLVTPDLQEQLLGSLGLFCCCLLGARPWSWPWDPRASQPWGTQLVTHESPQRVHGAGGVWLKWRCPPPHPHPLPTGRVVIHSSLTSRSVTSLQGRTSDTFSSASSPHPQDPASPPPIPGTLLPAGGTNPPPRVGLCGSAFRTNTLFPGGSTCQSGTNLLSDYLMFSPLN